MADGADLDWARFIPALTAFVRRRVSNPANAEDVVQAALVKAVAALPELRRSDRLEAWLYRVTRGAVIDHYRARSRRRESPVEDVEALAPAFPAEPDADVLGELAACAGHMAAGLPPAYRDALDLVDRQGLLQAEAARRLGIGLPALKARVRRGRLMLRETVQRCCRVALDAGGRPMEFEDGCTGGGPCGTGGAA